MMMRQPYGRNKHKRGAALGQMTRMGRWDDSCLLYSCLVSCVCINQLLCSCSDPSETSGCEGGKCAGPQSEFLNHRVGDSIGRILSSILKSSVSHPLFILIKVIRLGEVFLAYQKRENAINNDVNIYFKILSSTCT